MKHRPRRLAPWLVAILAGFIAMNAVAWRHAVAMTTWAADGARTPPPEELDLAGKLRALALGVRIPRPREDRDPTAVGLLFEEHRLEGPAGPLVAVPVDGILRIGGSTRSALDRGAALETPSLHGPIVAAGRALGVPTPVNTALIALAERAHAEGWRPGASSAVELRREIGA